VIFHERFVPVPAVGEIPSEVSEDFFIPPTPLGGQDPSGPVVNTLARIAIYDNQLAAPRIIDVAAAPLLRFIENIASTTYEKAQQLGGSIPYTAIREISENFIHANFKECTVSVLDGGNTIRFSDQGPGIEKKLLVQQPGVSSATDAMRYFIRGVGSGFPIVREYLEVNNGFLQIDDNAREGVVVTISVHPDQNLGENRKAAPTQQASGLYDKTLPRPEDTLTTAASVVSPPPLYPTQDARAETRAFPQTPEPAPQKALTDARTIQALRIIDDIGAAGPTDLVEPLSISAATAYRLLQSLEDSGLLEKTVNRKRILSNAGMALLMKLTRP
jgi:hypothetical protein